MANLNADIMKSSGNFALTGPDGIKVSFQIAQYDANQKTGDQAILINLFQTLQDKLDQKDTAATRWIRDVHDMGHDANVVRIVLGQNNGYMDSTGQTLNYKFDKIGSYYTKAGNGAAAEFTPERAFAHELTHMAGERTLPPGNTRNPIDLSEWKKYFL